MNHDLSSLQFEHRYMHGQRVTELSGGVVSLLNKRRRACLGVECQIVGDAVAYRNQLHTNCLAEAYKLSYIVGSLPLAKNAKHSPSII